MRLIISGRDTDPAGWWQVVSADGTTAWISNQVVEALQADQIALVALMLTFRPEASTGYYAYDLLPMHP